MHRMVGMDLSRDKLHNMLLMMMKMERCKMNFVSDERVTKAATARIDIIHHLSPSNISSSFLFPFYISSISQSPIHLMPPCDVR